MEKALSKADMGCLFPRCLLGSKDDGLSTVKMFDFR